MRRPVSVSVGLLAGPGEMEWTLLPDKGQWVYVAGPESRASAAAREVLRAGLGLDSMPLDELARRARSAGEHDIAAAAEAGSGPSLVDAAFRALGRRVVAVYGRSVGQQVAACTNFPRATREWASTCSLTTHDLMADRISGIPAPPDYGEARSMAGSFEGYLKLRRFRAWEKRGERKVLVVSSPPEGEIHDVARLDLPPSIHGDVRALAELIAEGYARADAARIVWPRVGDAARWQRTARALKKIRKSMSG